MLPRARFVAPPHHMHQDAASHPVPLDHDFILIAEFSEQEGPKPLLTIPKDGSGKFDQNTFAVRIMAVDYQAQNRESRFSLAVDTQVVQSENDEHVSAHVYVHHFTLYDVFARGYVRPFCMSYVTGDQRKLMQNFEELMKQFSQVSETLRYTNMRMFYRDLKHRMAELKQSEKTLQEKMDDLCQLQINDDITVDDNNQKEVPTFIGSEEMDERNEDVVAFLGSVNADLNTNEDDDYGDDDGGGDDDESMWHAGFEVCSSGRSELAEIGFKLEAVKSSLVDMKEVEETLVKELSRDAVATKLRELDSKEESQRKAPHCSYLHDSEIRVNPLAESTVPHSPLPIGPSRRFDVSLRSLSQLCDYGEEEALQQLQLIHSCFSRRTSTVFVERQEARVVAPPSSLLTIGRCPVLNFRPHIDLMCNGCASSKGEQHYHLSAPKGDLAASTLSLNSVGSFQTCVDGENNQFAFDNRFLRAESSWSVYLDAVEPCGSSDLSRETESIDDEYHEVNPDDCSGSGSEDDESNHLQEVGAKDANPTETEGHVKELSSDHCDSSDIREYPSDVPSQQGVSVQLNINNSPTDLALTGKEALPFLSDANHVEDSSERKPVGPSQQVASVPLSVTNIPADLGMDTLPFLCYANHVEYNCEKKPGKGILNFRNRLVFLGHLIYALLQGRTVIALGEDENTIRSVIQTLWLFVPGHSSHQQVIPWHTNRLQLSDLARVKLIGLKKKKKAPALLPLSIEHYVTVLDYDAEVLLTPPYTGRFVDSIVARQKQWKVEDAYIAHIHSVFLEIAQKAFIFYHTYIMNPSVSVSPSTSPITGGDGLWRHEKQLSTRPDTYLANLDVTQGDVDIVQYFAEIICRQQMAEYQDTGPPAIKLDHRRSQMYQNSKPHGRWPRL